MTSMSEKRVIDEVDEVWMVNKLFEGNCDGKLRGREICNNCCGVVAEFASCGKSCVRNL